MRTWFTSLVLFALAAPAMAQAPGNAKAEAKVHLDLGTRYFNVQQFDKAIAEFQQAYVIDPLPEYLYALAQAQRSAGDCKRAIQSYENFVRTGPGAKFEALAKANIERCKKELELHPPPKEDPVPVPPPQVPPPRVPPPQVTAVPPPAEPQRGDRGAAVWYRDWAGHALVGSGVAVVVTGVVLYVGAKREFNEVRAAQTYDEFLAGRADLDGAHTKQQVGVTAMVIGGGLVAGGVVHYVLHTRKASEHPVAAVVSPGKAMLVFSGAF